MTREEEILKEGNRIICEYFEKFDIDKLHSFQFGVRWADAHPQNPWRDAKTDLPDKMNKYLSVPVLCRYTRGGKEYNHVSQYDYDYKQWQIDNVTYWMSIPEPKGGEK